MNDYLAAEKLIIDRLQEEMGSVFKVVSGWSDYASVEEARLPTPSAYVIYQGDALGSEGGNGSVQRVDQRWGIVIVVRNVSKRSNTKIRDTAGPLMAQVMELFMGHQLNENYRPMVRLPAPEPEYSDRVGYFPLLFSAAMFMTGENA